MGCNGEMGCKGDIGSDGETWVYVWGWKVPAWDIVSAPRARGVRAPIWDCCTCGGV